MVRQSARATGEGAREDESEKLEPQQREGAEMRKPASLVAVIVFWLIALAQLLRIILRVRVTAGSHEIPFWLSAVAFVVLGALGMWLWRERREERDEL